MKTRITMKETRLEKTGKVTFKPYETNPWKRISRQHYHNIVDSIGFFKRLGGTETTTYGYTCDGYNIVKLVSTNPSRDEKTIREFRFHC